MWCQHILPSMECELQSPEVLAAALQPIIYMINEATVEEFQAYILPFIKNIFQMPKSVQVGGSLYSLYILPSYSTVCLRLCALLPAHRALNPSVPQLHR